MKLSVIWCSCLTILLFILFYMNCIVLHNEACQDDQIVELEQKISLLEYSNEHPVKDTIVVQNQIFLK